MTFPEDGIVNQGETIRVFALENHIEPPVLNFGKSNLTINCLSDFFCKDIYIDEDLVVEKGAYFNGNIYLQKDGSQNIYAFWNDLNAHAVLSIDEAGIATKIGWDGISDKKTYQTVLNLQGQTVTAPNVGGITITSDERLKNSFNNLDVFDNIYMDLQPLSFKYNNGKSGRNHFGFGAAQVKESLEKHGFTTKDFAGFVQMSDSPDNENYCGIDDPMGLIYTEFIAWNTHMIQKLYKENETLKQRITNLEQAMA